MHVPMLRTQNSFPWKCEKLLVIDLSHSRFFALWRITNLEIGYLTPGRINIGD